MADIKDRSYLVPLMWQKLRDYRQQIDKLTAENANLRHRLRDLTGCYQCDPCIGRGSNG